MKLIVNDVEYPVIYCAHASDKLYVNCAKDIFNEILEAVESGNEISCIDDSGAEATILSTWAIESTYFIKDVCKLTFKRTEFINSVLARLESQRDSLINAKTDIENLQADNVNFREDLLDTQEALAELYESLI